MLSVHICDQLAKRSNALFVFLWKTASMILECFLWNLRCIPLYTCNFKCVFYIYINIFCYFIDCYCFQHTFYQSLMFFDCQLKPCTVTLTLINILKEIWYDNLISVFCKCPFEKLKKGYWTSLNDDASIILKSMTVFFRLFLKISIFIEPEGRGEYHIYSKSITLDVERIRR